MLSTATELTEHTDVARRESLANAPIRVVHCIDNLAIGGTELNAVRTAERLDRSRFDLTVVCLGEDGSLAARFAAAGVPVVRFPIANLYGLGAARQGARLARFLSHHCIQIVHSHDMYSNVFATVWARAAGTPVIVASRRWWRSLPPRRYRVANKLAFRLAHQVIANSPAVASSLQSEDHVPSTRIAVVPNFVDDDAFTPMSAERRAAMLHQLGVPDEALTVGIIANLSPVKDHQTLLHAVALLAPRWPRLHVVLIGDGECRTQLEWLARDLEIECRVHFAGLRPNVPNLHHLFAISVLCSRSEGFPNSIVEAMAAARPVVATDVGGVADAVSHGETGVLVPPANPPRLAAAIEELLLDPERRQLLGSAGLRHARTRYGASTVLQSLEAVYTRLLGAAAT